MKYNISINQKSIIDLKINIDISDAAILDWMLQFSHSLKINKIDFNGKTYYFFSYQKIKNDLPILSIGKDAIYRRLKKMCDIGLLVAHPENQTLNRPFYSFSELMLSIFIHNTEHTVQTPNPYGFKTETPTVQTPHDNSIINNNIKIEEGEPAPVSFENKSFKKWNKDEFSASIKAAREKRKAEPQKPNFTTEMLTAFFAYWSEPDAAGKMRFQKQDTWATANRLVTWEQRDKN